MTRTPEQLDNLLASVEEHAATAPSRFDPAAVSPRLFPRRSPRRLLTAIPNQSITAGVRPNKDSMFGALPEGYFGDCLVNLNDDEGYNFDRIAEVIEEAYISGGDNEHP